MEGEGILTITGGWCEEREAKVNLPMLPSGQLTTITSLITVMLITSVTVCVSHALLSERMNKFIQ